MQKKSIAGLLRPFGTSASTAELPQDKSTAVCWLLRANCGHPNLSAIEEGDWQSLLDLAEELAHRE